MNVIKLYDPLLQKNKSNIYKSYHFTIHNDDLKINIDKEYKWTN